MDAREEDPEFYAPEALSSAVPTEEKGVLKRMVAVRAREVGVSLGVVRSVLGKPLSEPWSGPEGRRGSGPGFGRCEGPEGETCCHLRLERGRLIHVAFSLPGELNRSAAFCLSGAWLDEAEALLPLLLPGYTRSRFMSQG